MISCATASGLRPSQWRSLMARVTAMGCVASALVGAALAVEPDAWKAVALR